MWLWTIYAQYIFAVQLKLLVLRFISVLFTLLLYGLEIVVLQLGAVKTLHTFCIDHIC